MTTLDKTVAYLVAGFGGIAFTLKGWDVTYPPPDYEEEESDTWVRVVMVGDDTVHAVELTDLTPLPDDAYCHECGQIGCANDGRAS